MPNIDPDAKNWELDLAERFGRAVSARRKALGLTAVQLAARTSNMGYPITRVTITKIETNNRAGKIDVAELVALAAALAVSPLQLLYPDLVDGPVQLFPYREVPSMLAVGWFTGSAPLNPMQDGGAVSHDYSKEYLDGTTSLRLATLVDNTRSTLLTFMHNPAYSKTMGPGTESFTNAMNTLEVAKNEARNVGLIVKDENDGA